MLQNLKNLLLLSRILICILLFCTKSIKAQLLVNNTLNSNLKKIFVGNVLFGSGISFVDFDQDGYDDLTIGTEQGDSLLFYKNNANGVFTKLPPLVIDTGFQKQVLWFDLDNDKDLDLFIANYSGKLKLFERLNNGSMLDITTSSGLTSAIANYHGANFGDLDNDNDLDLFISVRGINSNKLYRNNGNKTFTDITQQSGISIAPALDLCSIMFDIDKDNDLDIYTIVDKYGTNKLYKNNGNLQFIESGSAFGLNITLDAMNGGLGDFNNDGHFDIYVTNSPYSSGNHLMLNTGGPYFINIANSAGVECLNQNNWGAAWIDFNNDKFLDLYVCKDFGASNRLFINNKLESFNLSNPTPFYFDTLTSYAIAVSDFNSDGKMDFVLPNSYDDSLILVKNNFITNNNYVKFKLEGTNSNKFAVGSLITVFDGDSAQYRFTTCAINYLAQNSLTEHFGLGTNTIIDSVHIKWPNNSVSKFYNLGVNQTFKVKEGSCLSHEYITPNTSANRYIGTNGNLMQASNWSKNRLPIFREDIVIENTTSNQLNLTLNPGNTINGRSLTLIGNVMLSNYGTINLKDSYGSTIIINNASQLKNFGTININRPCTESLLIKGSYVEKGLLNSNKN